jgi:nucleotide-binding universal stress UspA family protein
MSIFPTRILLATDGSEGAKLASDTAATLAASTGSELHVVCVGPGLPLYEVPDYPARFEEVVEEQRQETRGVLDELVKTIEDAGTAVAQSHLEMDERPDRAIVELAEKLSVGLIVLGSRGLGGLKRTLLGSVSTSVVRHAHCPVMIARWKPVVFPAKILLATDASDEAHLAAATAADLAQRTGSQVHVAHVGAELTHGAFPAVQVGPLPGVHQDELDRQAKGLLEAETERMKSSGTEVGGSHLRRGRADKEIVLLAEEEGADLIVMGSRGLGGIRQALMGSVSDSVVRHAHCPVMVVRS